MDRDIVRQLNNGYNERLRLLVQGNNTNFNALELGMPSQFLLEAGIPNLPIQMSVQKLAGKKMQVEHPFKLVSVIDMPEYLGSPLAIFRSKTVQGSLVILTEMEEKDVNFVVIIDPNRPVGNILVNSIRSVYPKDNIKDVLLWISVDNLLINCDKEKILNWINKQQSNSADVANLIKDTVKVLISF